ncbi:hydroxymethylglutaryl-CoA synthase family protein [Tahibacter harae]|uniref:Hydroxymethylglutaryl-CoA synthase family protein n=1 Tax=Tahibacter harae TaxID=2963937 RepID=A0ABT1QLS2_9GAMM|nr:hydroxymethylglutaryl-CoA synthase family protein [Tahibacter harae]MCQ4163480.1 hydroxymethylglutaryl-CoA synthase family protein [Tahibacter harae]
MSVVGIEAMNVFGGTARIGVIELMDHRGLDTKRADNLLMVERSVALPQEDPISFAVNAAKPLIDALSPAERDRIELLITCSESGIDFGKSMSTYVHHYLGLNRNCRLFELKQACYSGTAGFQMAVNFILSQTSPGAKALVIATDIARAVLPEGVELSMLRNSEWGYAEPSSGAGAVALLVSDTPRVFQVDVGANGYYGYEVMDTCRPVPDGDVGDSDLSLMSYLDCCENAYLEYAKRVDGADYASTFQYLVFHTPFGGMVKGAHRTLMRKLSKADRQSIENDFNTRVMPGLDYCQRVGNIMGATVFLSLASTIDRGDYSSARRLGCFSYGSGCCSEFFSGVVQPASQQLLAQQRIDDGLNQRVLLNVEEYDQLMIANRPVRFGVRDLTLDPHGDRYIGAMAKPRPLLYLSQVAGFHRKYEWVA